MAIFLKFSISFSKRQRYICSLFNEAVNNPDCTYICSLFNEAVNNPECTYMCSLFNEAANNPDCLSIYGRKFD
jgi:hypothetical protein